MNSADRDCKETGHAPERRSGDGIQLPTLRVIAGADLLASYAIYPGEQVVMGRSPECDLVLSDPSVSRRHAVLTENGGRWFVDDLGSTNGTATSSGPVHVRAQIEQGEVFYVGNVALRLDTMGVDEIQQLERVAERLRTVAHDALTGVLARQWLTDELPGLLSRHRAADRATCALFVDLDHFKNVNDTHGHAVGDSVLQATGGILSAEVREGDRVIRYGGEEFLVILSDCSEEAGGTIARRIRDALECYDWGVATGVEGLSVTASFGIAQNLATETIGQWLDRADQAMYAAKGAGRNCVRVASHVGEPA